MAQKVRAIAKGFYGGQLRNEGEVFVANDGEKASWFVAVDSAERGPKPPKGRGNPADLGGGDLA